MQKLWAIIISQNGLSQNELAANPNGRQAGPSEVIPGHDEEIRSLLAMLEAADNPPVRLFFTTEGVSLVTEGSPVLGVLKTLEARGMDIVACRTCLDYMRLRDQVAVGRISTEDHLMRQIEEAGNVVAI
ncbi:MAG: DsrE family protein [Anaerolineae bacterium]